MKVALELSSVRKTTNSLVTLTTRSLQLSPREIDLPTVCYKAEQVYLAEQVYSQNIGLLMLVLYKECK